VSILEHMLEVYGLERILEQNDIEELTVLELLVVRGLIDVEDYIYTDVKDEEDDDVYRV
jgi:hypothetical protein